ncbi:MAG: tetratricopeptide repeat protein, partial [Bacteroidales bacterium]|nr:tetratricopeptide repeat protein [Bacteroidales bacterium]
MYAIFRISTNDSARISLLNQIAYSLAYTGPDESYKIAKSALELSNKTKNNNGRANSLMSIGHYFRVKGLYERAAEYHFEALKVLENDPDKQLVAQINNQIGIVYYQLGDFQSSLEYYINAHKVFTDLEDKTWLAAINNNIGMIYEGMGDYEKALQYYYEAVRINHRMGNDLWLGNNYGNIGNVYRELNDSKCIDFYGKWKNLLLKDHNLDGLASVFYETGLYFLQVPQFDSALSNLMKSYDICLSIGSLGLQKDAAREISRTYFKLGQYESAYFFQQKYIHFSDSLRITEVLKNTARLDMDYKFGKEQQFLDIEESNRR